MDLSGNCIAVLKAGGKQTSLVHDGLSTKNYWLELYYAKDILLDVEYWVTTLEA